MIKRTAVAVASFAIVAAVIFLIGCPFALVVRQPCPGCGLTRATLAAMHGDFHASFHHHPLAIVMVPLVGWFLARNGWGYVVRGQWGEADAKTSRAIDAALIALGLLMMGVWIARFFGAFGGPEPVG
jgi:hypothetical protein